MHAVADTPTAARPVYQHAKERLLDEIQRTGQPGTRLPTVGELASQFGVGHVSMHRAVRELADEGYLTVRPRAGITVAEQQSAQSIPPTNAARAIAGRTIDIITMPEPQVEGMHRRMIEGIHDRLRPFDCRVECKPLLGTGSKQSFDNHDSDGLVFINASRSQITTSPRHCVVNLETGLINQFSPTRAIDHVTVNQLHGAAIAGHAMHLAGVRDVCYVGAHGQRYPRVRKPPYDLLAQMRLQGFESAFGQRIPRSHQLITDFYDESAGAGVVSAFMKLSPMPEAVFAATDELAIGFVHGALAHGLKPGRDYQIIGFDGQRRGQVMRGGPLTTVAVPAYEMGCKAAELLIERFQRRDRPSQTVSLGCELLTGATLKSADTRKRGD